MLDLTPEERANRSVSMFWGGRELVEQIKGAFVREIREAEATARVAALRESEKALGELRDALIKSRGQGLDRAIDAARAKAFEEAEAFLDEELSRQEKVLAEASAFMKKLNPGAARALSESPPPSSYQRVKSVLDRLRMKIRARAEEASRVE